MMVKTPQDYIILVDMDGVIAEWQKQFDTLLTAHYPHIQLIPGETHKIFKSQTLYAAEHQSDIAEMMNMPGFYRNLEPVEGAVEALWAMVKAGYNVFLCTAPYVTHETCASEKMQWVKEHLGEYWLERMVISSDKTIVHGDILIDDKPKIKGAMKPHWTHLAFARSYNTDVPLRLESWDNWQSTVEGIIEMRESISV